MAMLMDRVYAEVWARIRESASTVDESFSEPWRQVMTDAERELGAEHAAVTVMRSILSGQTIDQIADRMHYERRTIRRYKEKYITCVAVKAAARGLLKGIA